MKSEFKKGDAVRTKERDARKIEKGKIKGPVIESGVVVGNEHFDRFVRIKLPSGDEVTTRPEYLEIVP